MWGKKGSKYGSEFTKIPPTRQINLCVERERDNRNVKRKQGGRDNKGEKRGGEAGSNICKGR